MGVTITIFFSNAFAQEVANISSNGKQDITAFFKQINVNKNFPINNVLSELKTNGISRNDLYYDYENKRVWLSVKLKNPFQKEVTRILYASEIFSERLELFKVDDGL